MAYRGEDLDLRNPQGRSVREPYGAQELGLNGSRGRSSAVYVDDTVLACCNRAYDIAQAHGAHEVQLEHLVHALTRVEAAAEVLERRGIREAHLRRESAAVMAADIPMGLSPTASPRASTEFETVLRRASELAVGRNASASVDDLLWVLLNFDRENPAIALLMRHALNWQQWDWPHRRERTMDRLAQSAAQPAPMPAYPSQNNDHLVGRLADMEGTVRAMHSDIANDRRLLTDLMREMRRDFTSSRGENQKLPSGLLDRIGGVESKVDLRFDQVSRAFDAIEDRLDALQKSPSGGPIATTIPAQLYDRLSAIERALSSQPRDENDRTAQMLTERLATVEKGIAASLAEGARNWAMLSDRLKGLDRVLSAVQTTGGTGGSTELLLVAEQMQSAAGHVQNVNDRLSALERIVAERFGGLERVATERQSTLEKRLVEQTAHMERMLGDRLIAAERSQLERLSEIQRLLVGFDEKAGVGTGAVKGISTLLDTHSQQMQLTLKGALTNLAQPLIERMAQVEQNVERQQAQTTFAMNTLMEKTSSTTTETGVQHVRELSELHEALVQLGQNQKSLSESLDQWRQESGGDLGVISNRLTEIERSATMPTSAMTQLQADIQGLQQVTLADYDKNRRGVRHWLFGTDDVFAGSWRDDTAQLRARLKEREVSARVSDPRAQDMRPVDPRMAEVRTTVAIRTPAQGTQQAGGSPPNG